MQPRRERLTHRDLAHAKEPLVHIELSTKDAELLMRLQQAGVINVPGLDLAEPDARLVDWTWEEYTHFLRFERRRKLSKGTAEQYVRYLQFLEDPEGSPWWREDFDPPPSLRLRPPREEDWKDIFHYYLLHGKDGRTLNNHRRALQPLLEFLRIPRWPSLEGSFPEAPATRLIPHREIVPEFWTRRLDPDPYLAEMWKTIFHFNFHAGLRPPSELCDLKLSKVDFDRNRISFWEEKKDRWRHNVPFPAFMISGNNGPSLRWYVDHVRPKVADEECDALFVTPWGTAWNHRTFGQWMSQAGKRVWDEFIPYCTRHWFAVQFLIANEFNVYATAKRLGDTVAVVERYYLPHAEARADLDRRFTIPRLRGGSE